MVAAFSRVASRGAAFTRGLRYPNSALLVVVKDTPCWTAAAAASYHSRSLGLQVGGSVRQTHSHPLLRSTPVITVRAVLTCPPGAPGHRQLSSFSDIFKSAFTVKASSQDTDVSAGVDSVGAGLQSPVVGVGVDGSVGGVGVADISTSVPPPPPPPSLQAASETVEYIPLPPVPPDAVEVPLTALGEPTFASLGLGGWSPIGIMQNCLEYIHISGTLPWWATIAIATVILRSLIFPLVVVSQRNAAKMNNYMPQLQVLQMKMTEARNSGDQINAARYSQEMVMFMKEKELSPLRNIVVPFAQAPIFISMFIGLRRMANLPVDSLREGGLAWFTDLTLADPYYLLPIITSCTMLATIELGTDGARLSSQNMQAMKYVLRALPFVIFPFTMNFPAAILCYWVSTNLFSLVQVGFLRVPAVRDYFKIDPLIKHKPETLPKKKGAVEGFKESWKNMKIAREIEERHRYDEMRFKKAGTGPVVRTYRHDPTKKIINVQAKVKK